MGFPRAESRGELNVSSRDVDPADWVYFAPHLAPEARVFDFVLFSDGVSEVDGQAPSSDQSPITNGKLGFHAEDEYLKDSDQDDSDASKRPGNQDGAGLSDEIRNDGRSCSAGSLEREALLLLDVAKEQDPVSKEVRQNSEERPN